MKRHEPLISIVIPVYNEERRIERFLNSVLSFLQKGDVSHEIIVVDDGSRDATVDIVRRLLHERHNGENRVLLLPANQGKGGAVRHGMLDARGEYVFFIDADGSTAIEEINTFLPHLSPEYDIYIGVRTKKHHAPLKRKFFGYGYIYCANVILGTAISDFTCGFKCYRRDAARQIFTVQTLRNWSFDAENLFVATRRGYRIKEIPVYWRHCGGSKVKVMHNVVVCGCDLFRIRWNNIRGCYTSCKP